MCCFSSSFMTVHEDSLGYELLAGQRKQPEDVSELWAAVMNIFPNFLTLHSLKDYQPSPLLISLQHPSCILTWPRNFTTIINTKKATLHLRPYSWPQTRGVRSNVIQRWPPALTTASCRGPASQLFLTEGITLEKRVLQERFRIFISLVLSSKAVIVSDHSDSMNRRTLMKSEEGFIFIS